MYCSITSDTYEIIFVRNLRHIFNSSTRMHVFNKFEKNLFSSGFFKVLPPSHSLQKKRKKIWKSNYPTSHHQRPRFKAFLKSLTSNATTASNISTTGTSSSNTSTFISNLRSNSSTSFATQPHTKDPTSHSHFSTVNYEGSASNAVKCARTSHQIHSATSMVTIKVPSLFEVSWRNVMPNIAVLIENLKFFLVFFL